MGNPQPGAAAGRRRLSFEPRLAASQGRRQRDPGTDVRAAGRLRRPRRLSGRGRRYHRAPQGRGADRPHGASRRPDQPAEPRTSIRTGCTQALERAPSGNRRVAVLCVDLDLFKNVNDSFGHPMGDRLLKQVAERLKPEVRGDNLVARLGGDEFAIVLASDASPNDASDFAARLIEMLSVPLRHRRARGRRSAPASASRCRRATATTCEESDAQRRHGAVPRQVGRRRRPSFLRAGNGPPGAEAPRHGARPAPRLRQWRIRTALSAAGRCCRRPHQRASNRCCAGGIRRRA